MTRHIYIHRVNYYETDKMGITHHSNYLRWMEEARLDFLKSIGYGMRQFEEQGVSSPVASVECQYKRPTTFDDEIAVEVWVERYNGVKLTFGYSMTDSGTGAVAFTAQSTHCFLGEDRRPVAIRKRFPEFDAVLRELSVS